MEYHRYKAEHGGIRPAARAIGVPESTFRDRLKKEAEVDPAIQFSMEHVGTEMIPTSVWIKSKTHSVQLRPKSEVPPEINLVEKLATAFDNINAAPLRVAPPANTREELCTLYPLMDAHFGMYADSGETGGGEYNLELALEDARRAFAKVLSLSPNSQQAILLLGGDTFHANDNQAETPESRHRLDTDGRFDRVVEGVVDLLGSITETLRQKHEHVLVRVLRGNHDRDAHRILTHALRQRYRDTPDVEVEHVSRDLFMYQWGRAAIFAHHGDRVKPQNLVLSCADAAPFWSETYHRYLFTGHIHHDSVKDFGAVRWESLRAFCPPDAYSASMGYVSRRALQALTFDANDGLILRVTDPIR